MEDNNHDTLTRLKFLSKIRKGEKINVSANTLQPDSFVTSLSRSIFNTDNRQNTLTYIQNSINSAFQLFNIYIASTKLSEKTLAQQILSDICASKNGIRNLIITYQEDTMFCCSIETYLQTIDAKLGEYKQKYPDIFPTPGDSEESIGDITTHAINRSE